MKKFIIPGLVLALALFLLFAIRGHWDSWKSNAVKQKTNDAYVTSNQSALSTRITDTVRRVNVEDYQVVKAGQPILQLDDADYQAVVDEAQQAIEAAKSQFAANQDAKRAADAGIDNAKQAVAGTQAAAESAQAAIEAQKALVTQTAAEYHRQETLLAARATTQQQFEQALAARDSAGAGLQARQSDLVRAQAAIASAKAALAGAVQQRSQLNANDAMLNAQIASKTAALAAARVNLNYAQISAPADGRIGKLRVHPGQLLGAGVEIVDFIQDNPWIEANYQETQLARVRVGNMADISVDAFPGKHFHGYVAEIAPASGAATALLPPDNATGNFTRVVQRVPIKILFDQSSAIEMLRPGLSAQVTIHTDQMRDTSQSTSKAQ